MSLALKVNQFGGLIPALDPRLIPDNQAVVAENCYFYYGRLQGTYKQTSIYTLQDPDAVFVYRIPNNQPDMAHFADSTFLEFDNINTDVLKPALIEDTFQRYYWASSNIQPMYNTLARIQAGQNALILGINPPSVAPGVTPAAGGTIPESRAYVYTWVSAYGEESQPSPPTVANGNSAGTWNLTFTAALATDINGTNRMLAHTNIYRTVTGADGTTSFFFVAQIPIATLTYADSSSDTAITGNIILPSTNWNPPPSNLQGWVSMPNGMVAGWETNNIWFCEPYRPHTWPSVYTLSTDYEIVGMGVSGQMLVICTQVSPYWASGITPSAMTLSMLQAIEPCLTRGGILGAPEGVYYPSPNGLILVQAGLISNISREYMLKDAWLNLAQINTLRCARLGTAYYAWGIAQPSAFSTAFAPEAFAQADYSASTQGLLIDPANPRVSVSQLTTTLSDAKFNTFNDPWTGEVFTISQGQMFWFNVADTDPTSEVYTWRSKKFQSPNRKNIGAMKIYFDEADTLPVINPVPVVYTPDSYTAQAGALNADQWGTVALYADDNVIWAREIRTPGELMRLPSGLKASFYQLEVVARVDISSIQVGETVKDLAKV